MFKVTAFVIAVIGVTLTYQVEARAVPDEHDNISTDTLEHILTGAEIHLKVKSIESFRKEVVSGVRYTVDFISEDNRRCEATWVVQPWHSRKPHDVHATCK